MVLSDTHGGDAQEFHLMHYVTSQMTHLDALIFKLKVYVVEREGSSLLSFGKNDCRQLGHERSSVHAIFDQMPQLVSGLPPNAIFRQMAGGVDHSVVLLSDGTVYSWGSTKFGACGLLTERQITPPSQIRKLDDTFVLQVACGSHHSLILSSAGDVFFFGELFDGCGVHEPRRVTELGPAEKLKVTKIACGASYNACVVQDDNTHGLYTWGKGSSGVLGHGDCSDQREPKKVGKLPDCPILELDAGRFHLVLLTMKGEVIVQGYGDRGRLGLGDEDMRSVPEIVPNLPLCRSVAAGSAHTALLDEDLNVWAWGSNECGQLGLTNHITTFKLAVYPIKLAFFEGKGCCSVQLGDYHSLALTLYGLVYTWGSHDSGQLGRRYGALSGVAHGHEGSSMPVVVEDLMHRPAVQVAGTPNGSMAVTVFEYPSVGKEKFEQWKSFVKDTDECRRQKCCKEFWQLRDTVQKVKAGRKSCQWESNEAKREERRATLRTKQEERRVKALEFHRQDQGQSRRRAKQTNANALHTTAFVEQYNIASEMKNIAKPPISVTLEDFADFRRMREEKDGITVKRALGKVVKAKQVDEYARHFTYFDPPSSKSFRGLLAGLLSPSDILKQSASALYCQSPQRYLEKPALLASQCPGVLKLNPFLAIAPTPKELGYSLRSEQTNLGIEDNGEILEAPVELAGEENTVTIFGAFFKDDTEVYSTSGRDEWG